jgi:hypothetical protein
MIEIIMNNWQSLLLLSGGTCYLVIISLVSVKNTRPRRLTDAELLAKLALMTSQTEHDLFGAAAQKWHVPPERVEDDFKIYLYEGALPYYLRDWLRQKAKESGNTFSPPFSLNGRGLFPWLK